VFGNISDALAGFEKLSGFAKTGRTYVFHGRYVAFDQNRKSAKEIISTKKHLNERGINYLLNVGSDYLGRIPKPCARILREVGKAVSGDLEI